MHGEVTVRENMVQKYNPESGIIHSAYLLAQCFHHCFSQCIRSLYNKLLVQKLCPVRGIGDKADFRQGGRHFRLTQYDQVGPVDDPTVPGAQGVDHRILNDAGKLPAFFIGVTEGFGAIFTGFEDIVVNAEKQCGIQVIGNPSPVLKGDEGIIRPCQIGFDALAFQRFIQKEDDLQVKILFLHAGMDCTRVMSAEVFPFAVSCLISTDSSIPSPGIIVQNRYRPGHLGR